MSNELKFFGSTDASYGIVTAKVYDGNGAQVGTDVSCSEVGSNTRNFFGDMPTAVAGQYYVRFFSSDLGTDVSAQSINWDGTREVTGNPAIDIVEGSLTYQEAIRILLAESAGKVSISGNNVSFRDQADTKNRIVSTTDASGQRTAVTVDGS